MYPMAKLPIPHGLVTAVPCGLLLTTSACGAGGRSSPTVSPADLTDAVVVLVTNQTPDRVQLWTQYDDGAPRRIGVVEASASTAFTVPWQDADALSFHARNAARTRGERRASNALPVRPGDRLQLIVEAGSLWLRIAPDDRPRDGP